LPQRFSRASLRPSSKTASATASLFAAPVSDGSLQRAFCDHPATGTTSAAQHVHAAIRRAPG
jgi:hypothetical protein